MCPDGEVHQHEHDVSPFECDPRTGKFDRNLAVTMFHRSSADAKVGPERIRPLPVLQRTMHHLLHYVIEQRTNTSPRTQELNMYLYVRDRFRAVRADITCQHLVSVEVVEIIETIALFFIWAATKFTDRPPSEFDPTQNFEQVTDALSTIEDMLDALADRDCPLECEFRALGLLPYWTESGFNAHLMALSDRVIHSTPVSEIVKVHELMLLDRPIAFLRAVESLPIQFSAFALSIPSMRLFWIRSFGAIRKPFASYGFPRDFIPSLFDLSEAQWTKCREAFGLVDHPNGICFGKEQFDHTAFPRHIIPRSIRQRFDAYSCSDFLALEPFGEPVAPRPKAVAVPRPLFIPVAPSPPSRRPSPIAAEIEENVELIFPPSPIRPVSPEPEAPVTPPPNTGPIIFRPSDFLAMVPISLPAFSFSSVAILATDSSPTAVFVAQKLQMTPGAFFIGACNNCSFFLTLTSDIRANTTAVLSCNDSEDSADFPVFRLDTAADPDLAFRTSLRRSIVTGVTAFSPVDLAQLVVLTVSELFSILVSERWWLATANAVFRAVNRVISLIVDFINSTALERFLVPMEHRLISRSAIGHFTDSVQGLSLAMLDDASSRRPPSGSAWPICVRDGLSLSIGSFLLPLSTQFDPVEAAAGIVAPMQSALPDELIEADQALSVEVVLGRFTDAILA
jgi:hypothetical protein